MKKRILLFSIILLLPCFLNSQDMDDIKNAYELYEKGTEHMNKGNLDSALVCFKISLELYMKAGNPSYIAWSLNNMGYIYVEHGKLDEALKCFTESLELYRKVGNPSDIAMSLNNIGFMYSNQGKLEEALKYYTKALKLYKKTGDSSDIATGLHNIGLIYSRQGKLDEALKYYTESLELRRKVGNPSDIAESFNSIGTIYDFQGKLYKALKYYTVSLELFKKAYDPLGVSECLSNIGSICSEQGKLDEALKYYTKALELRRKVGNPYNIATGLSNIGSIYSKQGKLDEALKYYTESLELVKKVGNTLSIATGLNNIGVIYSKQGKLDEALKYYTESLELYKKYGNPSGIARSFSNIGYCYYKLKSFRKAEQYINECIIYLDSVRVGVGDVEARQNLTESQSNEYSLYYEVLNELNEKDKAFVISEKNRSRTLNELISESRTNLRQDADPELLNKERELNFSFKQIFKQISETKDDKELDILKRKQDSLYNVSKILEDQLKRSSPRYASVIYPDPVTADKVKEELGVNTALISFKEGIDNFYAMVITKDDYKVFTLRNIKTIESKVEVLINELRSGEFSSHFYSFSGELYKILLGPIEDIIKTKKELIIIPDGILHYIPFEVLFTRDLTDQDLVSGNESSLPYLIKDFDIRYLPSATMLKTFELYTDPEAPKDFICFADPVFESESELQLSPEEHKKEEDAKKELSEEMKEMDIEREGSSLVRLVNTGTEANGIAELFSPDNVSLYTRETANKNNLMKEDLSQYKYIHFATHGLVNNDKPQFSSLALSYDITGNNELQVREIFELKLNADMVVLSACNTALGKEMKGEGIIGLTRAFLVAGSKRAVVSLWSVADKSTSEFMIDFYRHIKEGKTITQSLREAKLNMINSKEYKHPYYWAPFVLFGME
ncbi:MAG: CHAT domain-containing protein [Ignavibacteria bacterium]|nr:CHAT domain-containing protein [Ignavibacteria bacterium]